MKKKKSSGIDGVSQECLLEGSEVLVIPLTRLINTSIQSGIFPEEWKLAVVTPLLKKGDQKNIIYTYWSNSIVFGLVQNVNVHRCHIRSCSNSYGLSVSVIF